MRCCGPPCRVGFPPGFWHFAVPTGIAGLIGTLALSRTEVFFLTWLSTPEAVGLFALAFGLAGHIFAPADALIGPLIPAVSGLHEVDQKALTPAFERVLRASSTIIALACAGGLPAFALLVPSFYGEEFADAAPLLLALGVAGALLAAGAPVSAFTLGRRSSRGLLTANIVALVVDVGLAITLIPLIGVWGAVIANVMGALSRLSLLVRGETRALGMSRRGVTRQVAPALLAMPIAVVVWLAGARCRGHRSWWPPWPPSSDRAPGAGDAADPVGAQRAGQGGPVTEPPHSARPHRDSLPTRAHPRLKGAGHAVDGPAGRGTAAGPPTAPAPGPPRAAGCCVPRPRCPGAVPTPPGPAATTTGRGSPAGCDPGDTTDS